MNTQIIIERIEELCRIHNTSINQMLKNAALEKSIVANLKKGSIPSISKINTIADYFNVSTDYLIGRTNSKINLQQWEYLINTRNTLELQEYLSALDVYDIKNAETLLSLFNFVDLWNGLPQNVQKEIKEDIEQTKKMYLDKETMKKNSKGDRNKQ